jgi:hypothetical protein
MDADAPVSELGPRLSARYATRYAGYTVRQLFLEMHEFYRSRNVKELQRLSFRDAAQPMIDYFLVFEEGCNQFPAFPTKCRACIRSSKRGACASIRTS